MLWVLVLPVSRRIHLVMFVCRWQGNILRLSINKSLNRELFILPFMVKNRVDAGVLFRVCKETLMSVVENYVY